MLVIRGHVAGLSTPNSRQTLQQQGSSVHPARSHPPAVKMRYVSQDMANTSAMAVKDSSPRVAVCGAGIIGASIAYYLSKMGVPATVIERTGIACGASGKAGGFLALDWCDGSPSQPLARRSFQLHQQLAAELGPERIGYRKVTTMSGNLAHNGKAPRSCQAASVQWLDGQNTALQEYRFPPHVLHLQNCLDGEQAYTNEIAGEESTAQVHPQRLTEAFLDAAQRQGSTVKQGTVDGLRIEDDCVKGVSIDGVDLPADVVVLAMGPWTNVAASWLPGVPKIRGRLGHSVVIKPSSELSAHCFYLTHSKHGEEVDVFVREDEVYVCGRNLMQEPPEDPAAALPDAKAVAFLKNAAGSLSSSIAEGTLLKEQACYRPLSQDGEPVIGPLSDTKGVYVATGHTCWGILNAPATGEAIAEMIVHGKSSLDLSRLSPQRHSLQF